MSRRLDKNSKIDYNRNMLGGQKARHRGQNAPKHSRRKEKCCRDLTLKGPMIMNMGAQREG